MAIDNFVLVWLASFILLYYLLARQDTIIWSLIGYTGIMVNGILGAYIIQNQITLFMAFICIIIWVKELVEQVPRWW